MKMENIEDKKTVTLPLSEYQRLVDFEKEILEGKSVCINTKILHYISYYFNHVDTIPIHGESKEFVFFTNNEALLKAEYENKGLYEECRKMGIKNIELEKKYNTNEYILNELKEFSILQFIGWKRSKSKFIL